MTTGALLKKLSDGTIQLGGCHDHGCVGSLEGIYTASMPVFVVENRANGEIAFCNSFEGASPKRLNYGVYDDEVRDTLLFLQDVAAPVIADAIRRVEEGIPLKPIIRRALNMGDELHSRNAAATPSRLRMTFDAVGASGPNRFKTPAASPRSSIRLATSGSNSSFAR